MNAWPPTKAPPTDEQRLTSSTWPASGWPSIGQLTYTKELITVVLLIIALPWLLTKLTRNPGAVLGAARNARL